ncbi:MAG: hypothetical protein IMZ44_22400 [Planctomycetes bacterium]|nr:hypothetical protein [Planctomycetota bacterium]
MSQRNLWLAMLAVVALAAGSAAWSAAARAEGAPPEGAARQEEKVREGARAEGGDLAAALRRIEERLANLEREIGRLREENANLRRELLARSAADRAAERPREPGRVEADIARERRGEGEAVRERRGEGEVAMERRVEGDAPKERRVDGEAARERRVEGDAPRERRVEGDAPKVRRAEGEGARERRGGEGEGARPPQGDRDGAATGLPAGLREFRGELAGTVVAILDNGLTLSIQRIEKVWEQSKADNPMGAVGSTVTVTLGRGSAMAERHKETLKGLKAGDRVVVEAFHLSGDSLVIMEQLRRAE